MRIAPRFKSAGRTPAPRARLVAAALIAAVTVGGGGVGCSGRHKGPRTVAALGSALAAGGSTSWAFGERRDNDAMVGAGFATVAVGVAALIIAGGWMAESAACRTDADCDDTETCREVPAPPSGVPYSQCIPR